MVGGAWCLACPFMGYSFSVHGWTVLCFCHFEQALSFRAESRNRQTRIIRSFSTPLELTDLALIE